VWDAASGTELFTFRGHDADVHRAAFSPDGLRLATADRSGKIVVWDATGGQEVRLPPASGLSLGAVFTADGERVVRPGLVGRPVRGAATQVHNLAQSEEAVTPHAPGSSAAIPIADGHGAFLTLGGDAHGEWTFWNGPNGRARALAGLTGLIYPAALHPDGSVLVAADGRSGQLQVVDVTTGTRKFLLPGHHPFRAPPNVPSVPYPGNVFAGEVLSVNGLAFHPSGHQFASAGTDGKLHVWDTHSGACLRTYTDHRGAVTGVAYDPKGRWLASTGGNNGTAHVYDANTGALHRTLRGGEGRPLSAVAFTPDGSRLATVGAAGFLRLWDPATGEEYLSVPSAIMTRSLAFSPDGRYLLAGEVQGGARVWESGESAPDTRTARLIGGARAWFTEHAADAEKQKDWFAAAWYLEQLIARDPKDADLRRRLEKVRTARGGQALKP
jgi:WD40 repeat protein